MTVTEIDRTNTAASVIPGRHNAFDVVGVDTSAAENVTDVMKTAGLLGWNVRTRAVETVEHTMTPEGVTLHPKRLLVPSTYAVIRDNPKTHEEEVIGTVGKKFRAVQNEQLVEFMGALVDAAGAPITRAADYYGNGRQVFFSIELPADVLVNGQDLLSYNLTIFTGHDGSLAITPVISQIRPMCANQRNLAIAESAAFMKIRHTKTAHDKMASARNFMGITLKTIAETNRKVDVLANKKLTDEAFWGIVGQVWELKSDASTRMQSMHRNRNESLAQILHGPTNAPIDGTAFAALNTITEHLQHSGENATNNARRTLRNPQWDVLANRAESLLLAV